MSGDCNKSALSCENPCSVKQPVNTAACETLASQIDNFTLNFFGEVFKTEINGQVSWSLPGRLDVGLLQNPRGATEPLGCYFLRLLKSGVIGAQGEQGAPGVNGANGNTPYVQLLHSLNQPAEGVVFPLRVSVNPTIIPGMDVFISGSGWYEIVTADKFGNLTVVLRKAVVVPKGAIPAGTFLIPSGKVGDAGTRGATGIQGGSGGQGPIGTGGTTGSQGPAAPPAAATIPHSVATIPTFHVDFPAPGNAIGYEGGFTTASFSPVILFPGGIPCRVTLAKPGTYLLMARVGFGATPGTTSIGGGQTGVVPIAQPGWNDFKLRNTSTGVDIDQSEAVVYLTGLIVTFCQTLSVNNSIQIFARSVVGAGVVSVTYFWAFKIS